MGAIGIVIQIYQGDCLEIMKTIDLNSIGVIVTDPPYGIEYSSGFENALSGVTGDNDTGLRDAIIELFHETPAIIFGSWKRGRPKNCKAVLTWEKTNLVGMGDLSLPWKPNTEEIYILGRGFIGYRGSSVIRCDAPVTWNSFSFGRLHAHQKPVSLMKELIKKCPWDTVFDPFMGVGSTAIACLQLNKSFIGIEIDAGYFDIAKKRIEKEQARYPLFVGMQ